MPPPTGNWSTRTEPRCQIELQTPSIPFVGGQSAPVRVRSAGKAERVTHRPNNCSFNAVRVALVIHVGSRETRRVMVTERVERQRRRRPSGAGFCRGSQQSRGGVLDRRLTVPTSCVLRQSSFQHNPQRANICHPTEQFSPEGFKHRYPHGAVLSRALRQPTSFTPRQSTLGQSNDGAGHICSLIEQLSLRPRNSQHHLLPDRATTGKTPRQPTSSAP